MEQPKDNPEYPVTVTWSEIPRTCPGYPADFKQKYEVLWQEIATFGAKWRLYLDLFGTEKSRKTLSDTAPGAFSLIESSLRNDLVMLMGRITDPARPARS